MKVLVGYDGSTSADGAIEDLRRAGLPQNTEALVVCVAGARLAIPGTAETAAGGSDHFWTSKFAEAEWLATEATKRIRSSFPQWTVSLEALWGDPASMILETSGWWHPDLIVVGSHGRTRVGRLFLGSVSLDLVHNAACSVRVARTSGSFSRRSPIRIIIGNDGSFEADAVIRSVAARSWPDQTEAKVLSVVQTLVPVPVTTIEASTFTQESAYSVVRESDERLKFRLANAAAESVNALRRTGLTATSTVVEGDPREVIIAEAAVTEADAIFVGARGLGRMERLLLGSVSSHVVTHAHCTVEVVRGK
jgi:nucleotide-binding universal stress UspA family protein